LSPPVTINLFTRVLTSRYAPIAVAAFVGFSLGLLVAALFFPPRIERAEVKTPAIEPASTPSESSPSTQKIPAVSYRAIDMVTVSSWQDDKLSEALPALLNACAMFDTKPENASVGPRGLGGTVLDWRAPCAALAGLAVEDGPDADDRLRVILSEFFTAYAVDTPEGSDGTFTGYYEASLTGSLAPSDIYSTPLFASPRDLVELDRRAFDLPPETPSVVGRVTGRRLVPYDSRKDIEQSAQFSERADVLVWVDNPVDAHLLHIQGSGRVRMSDGTERRIGYAGNNGRRFRGIGGILLSAGELGPGQGSMPSVVDWLKKNPEAARRYMEDNPRFIFFRWIEGPGPIGAFGTALVPGRSLAVDPRYIPYGAPLWLDVDDPDGKSLDRLVVALDTGSAIRGAVRGDFFWGAGEAAFMKAGRMKSTGRYYLMLPRTVTVPPSPASLSKGSAL
jgi:membrane-bound lytic murein transglycosylase A